MARKWLVTVTLVVLGLGGGVFFIWQEATTRLEQELDRWSEARRMEGWRIAHAPPQRTGFPLAAALKLDELRFDAPNGIGFTSERATLGLFANDHSQLHLSFHGAQRLTHPQGSIPVRSGSLGLRIRLDGAGGTLEGDRLAFGDELEVQQFTASLFGMAIDLRANQVAAAGLPRFQQVHVIGRATHPPTTAAAAWRAAGGAVNVERLELRSGSVIALLTAALSLDAALQPEGRGTLALTNPQEAVATLAAAGLIAPNLVNPLRAVLGFAARVPPEGGPPRVDLPLELRNRRLTAARLPVGSVPPIDWR